MTVRHRGVLDGAQLMPRKRAGRHLCMRDLGLGLAQPRSLALATVQGLSDALHDQAILGRMEASAAAANRPEIRRGMRNHRDGMRS